MWVGWVEGGTLYQRNAGINSKGTPDFILLFHTPVHGEPTFSYETQEI